MTHSETDQKPDNEGDQTPAEIQKAKSDDGSASLSADETTAGRPQRPEYQQSDVLPSVPDRYRLIRELGRGAMGSVYVAEDTQLKRQVALKLPRFSQSHDKSSLLERFYREARAAATLDHPNICQVIDIGEHNNTPYITMTLIHGRTLADVIRDGKALNQRSVALLVRKVALALAEAHDHGIIHRDLKPSNIMVNQRNEPVVMDFGLARQFDNLGDEQLTLDGTLVGTPAYMSPEQVACKQNEIGPSTDIFSLGIVFYELLTGKKPFNGSLYELIQQISDTTPASPASVRPEISVPIDSICMTMLMKSPDDRPSNMRQVAETLADYLRNSTTTQQVAGASGNGVAIAVHAGAEPSTASKASQPESVQDAAARLKSEAARINQLLTQQQWLEAEALLETMSRCHQPVAANYAQWAKDQLRPLQAKIGLKQTAALSTVEAAQRRLDEYDYVGAVELLSRIEPSIRSDEASLMLTHAIRCENEVEQLISQIERSLRTRRLQGTLRNLQRLVQLKPYDPVTHYLFRKFRWQGRYGRLAGHLAEAFAPAKSKTGMVYYEEPYLRKNLALVIGIFLLSCGLTSAGVYSYVKRSTSRLAGKDDASQWNATDGTSTFKPDQFDSPFPAEATFIDAQPIDELNTQTSASANVNLIANGSFEEFLPVDATWNKVFNDTDMGAWQVTGSVDVCGGWQAYEGTKSLDMNGTAKGTIAQTIRTTADKQYRLSFAVSTNIYNREPSRLSVWWNDQEITTLAIENEGRTLENMKWRTFEFNVEATGPQSILKFESLNENMGVGPALDAVSLIRLVDSNTPETSASETWKSLFNGRDFSGWDYATENWTRQPMNTTWTVDIAAGVLRADASDRNRMDTTSKFTDFKLSLHWRFPPGAVVSPIGSGVVVRGGENYVTQGANGGTIALDPQGIEIDLQPNQKAGSLIAYGRKLTAAGTRQKDDRGIITYAPTTPATLVPDDGWNVLELDCDWDQIKVSVNGRMVNQGRNTEIVSGRICLRATGSDIEFRNIRIQAKEPLSNPIGQNYPSSPTIVHSNEPETSSIVSVESAAPTENPERNINPGKPPVRLYVSQNASGQTEDGRSWETAIRNLQDALRVVRESKGVVKEVWIANGRYYPASSGGSRDASFDLVGGVAYRGGFAGTETDAKQRKWGSWNSNTHLNGDLKQDDRSFYQNRNDNSHRIVSVVGQTELTEIEMLRISHGSNSRRSDGHDNGPDRGAGIFVYQSPVIIRECHVHECETKGSGGGIFLGDSDAKLENLFVNGCRASSTGASLCVVQPNKRTTIVTSCEFQYCHGCVIGGLFYQRGGTARINNCKFRHCKTWDGGAIYLNGAQVQVNNCVVCKCSCDKNTPGLIANAKSNVLITNCTFADNTSKTNLIMDLKLTDESKVHVYNSILYSGTRVSLSHDKTSSLSISHSCVLKGYTADTVISTSPKFANSKSNDYRLQSGSPCIDTGDNTAIPIDVLDLDNDGNVTERMPIDLGHKTRNIGIAVDMGAHEFQFK